MNTKMKKVLNAFFLAAVFAIAPGEIHSAGTDGLHIIPQPQKVTPGQGTFKISPSTTICADKKDVKAVAAFFASKMKDATGYEIKVTSKPEAGAIRLKIGNKRRDSESYTLKVTSEGVEAVAPTAQGLFYAMQTFLQLLPPQIESPKVVSNVEWTAPAVTIEDKPRFKYRGLLTDVCRHFQTIETIKKQLDMMAMFKLNQFHWHLTEDQGWRIEIKRYPELTKYAAFRDRGDENLINGFYKPTVDSLYGGFYTQEQVREVVAYAKERFINVIPEFELPGHEVAAISAFPWLACREEPRRPWNIWGISPIVMCPGKDTTFEFIENVLAEMVELFPGKYFHIGGDESPRSEWEKCPLCQRRAKELGLKEEKGRSIEAQLQSYVVERAEKFLNKHGKTIIGWDEILEGGNLNKSAVVMSWRGEAGGIEAAKQHHDVVMTPNTYLYFDYYQSKDTETEPMAIGGYLPIERVYSYEPMPKSLSPEEQKYIVGVQANLWTEYIPDFKQVQYMVLPRMAALSESQWCAPEKKNYEAFLQRVSRLVNIYAKNGWNYATHIFDVMLDLKPNTETGTLDAVARTIDNAPIYYTLDGSEPTTASEKYTDVIKIDKPCTLRTVAIRPSGSSKITKDEISFSKSSMKPITMLQPINKQYEFSGATVLVDGMTGNMNYKTGRWIAFYTNDLEAVIDLKEATEISSMTLHTCVEKGDWIFDTRGITVSVSDDNQTFKEVASEAYPAMKESDPNQIYTHELKFDPVKTRYVKVKALSEQKIPSWHGGKGNPGFLFVDEIILN